MCLRVITNLSRESNQHCDLSKEPWILSHLVLSTLVRFRGNVTVLGWVRRARSGPDPGRSSGDAENTGVSVPTPGLHRQLSQDLDVPPEPPG